MDQYTAQIYSEKVKTAEEGNKMQNINWNLVKANLNTLGLSGKEQEITEDLKEFIRQCGYQAYPMIVDLSEMDEIDSDMGIIVTPLNEADNNGIYVFCVLKDYRVSLIVVVPSTITKGPMIRKVCGDLTDAITGIALPPLTAFDLVEVVGQVIVNTVMNEFLTAFGIPKERKDEFVRIYLPKFLANVAMYYTGAKNEKGEPILEEETVNMEPLQVRFMLTNGQVPEIFKAKEKEEADAGTNT